MDSPLHVAASGYGGRGYRVPTRLIDGKPAVYPGVTTVLDVLDKPGVRQWAVDQTAAYAVTHIDDLLSRTEEVGYGFLRYFWKPSGKQVREGVRDHHRKALDDLSELGTRIHEWIQADVNDDWIPPIYDERDAEAVAEWLDWRAGHELVPLLTEAPLISHEQGYAGSIDGLWRVTCLHETPCVPPDSVVLLDIKTSRVTNDTHRAQVSAYSRCPVYLKQVPADTVGAAPLGKTKATRTYWVEEPVPAWDHLAVLHVRPSDYDSHGNEVPAFCRLELVGDSDLHYRVFVGALDVKKAQRELVERGKVAEADDDW